MTRRVLITIVLASALLSCAPSGNFQQFVKASEVDFLGRYAFPIDFTDSLSRYDISVLTRIDSTPEKFSSAGDMRFSARFVSPEGNIYLLDEFVIPFESYTSSSTFTRDYVFPLLRGTRPVENGEWMLYISPEGKCPDGFRGLGIIIEKDSLWERTN